MEQTIRWLTAWVLVRITDFEYTVACAVFDMLDIALVHGWLLDEQDEKTVSYLQVSWFTLSIQECFTQCNFVSLS